MYLLSGKAAKDGLGSLQGVQWRQNRQPRSENNINCSEIDQHNNGKWIKTLCKNTKKDQNAISLKPSESK